MPDNELDKHIAARVAQIFPDPSTAAKMVNLVVNKKPQGWGRRSSAPYYKEFYAKGIRDEVDKMLVTRQDIVYRYDKFCGEDEVIMSRQTLYNRVNQSLRYLVEQMDTTDNKYNNWYRIVNVSRESGLGICIRFIPEYRSGSDSSFRADAIIPKEDAPLWRRRMEDWLEGDSTTPFHQSNLSLNSDEIVQLKRDLGALKGIAASVTSDAIKIVRMN